MGIRHYWGTHCGFHDISLSCFSSFPYDHSFVFFVTIPPALSTPKYLYPIVLHCLMANFPYSFSRDDFTSSHGFNNIHRVLRIYVYSPSLPYASDSSTQWSINTSCQISYRQPIFWIQKKKLSFHSWLFFPTHISYRSLNKSLFWWLAPLPVTQTINKSSWLISSYILFLANQLVIKVCCFVTIQCYKSPTPQLQFKLYHPFWIISIASLLASLSLTSPGHQPVGAVFVTHFFRGKFKLLIQRYKTLPNQAYSYISEHQKETKW